MGNAIFPQHMVLEKFIAGKPYHISLGVSGVSGSTNNPFKEQVIRVGTELSPLRSMVSFQETEQSIHCQFEGDIHLKFMRRDNDIIYFLSTPEYNVTDKVVPFIRKHENIGLHSPEFDRLFNFLRTGMDIEQQ